MLEATNTRVTENRVDQCLRSGIAVTGTTVAVDDNQVTDCQSGISGSQLVDATFNNNTVRRIAGFGGAFQSDNGFLRITNNELENCGLQSSADVIRIVASSGADSIVITGNEYSGAINNLNYFISCPIGPPKTIASNNRTSTTLPSKIGP